MAPLLTADTSVVVPALIQWHEAHAAALTALRGVKTLPAQVLSESFSVLTRLPGGTSLRPRQAETALSRAFPDEPLVLRPSALRDVIRRLAQTGLGGGRVYDAVVAAQASEAGARILTRDRRALSTYAMFGLDCEMVV